MSEALDRLQSTANLLQESVGVATTTVAALRSDLASAGNDDAINAVTDQLTTIRAAVDAITPPPTPAPAPESDPSLEPAP